METTKMRARGWFPAATSCLAVTVTILISTWTTAVHAVPVHYGKHGLDWADGHCGSRALQSPINIDRLLGEAEPASGAFRFHYPLFQGKKPRMWRDDSDLVVDLAGALKFKTDAFVRVDDQIYDLDSIRFKAQSEHMFKGKHFPLEMQIIHKKRVSAPALPPAAAAPGAQGTAPPAAAPTVETQEQADAGYKVIVSVLFEAQEPIDEAASFVLADMSVADYDEQLQKFIEQMPFPLDDKRAVLSVGKDLDLSAFVADASFVQYYGSVTRPPCTEAVTWLVRQQPYVASKEQLQDLANLLRELSAGNGNWRTNMPVGPNRAMKLVAAQVADIVDGNPAEKNELGVYNIMPAGPNPRTDDEFRSIQKIKMAKSAAKKTLDYVNNVKQRYVRAHKLFVNKIREAGVMP